jgi:hypothetical protein
MRKQPRQVGELLQAERIKRRISVEIAANRSRLKVAQIERVESGGGRFRTARAYAVGLGRTLMVKGFYPQKNVTAAEMARRTGMDERTCVGCQQIANSPANAPWDVEIACLELFLGSWSSTSHIALE